MAELSTAKFHADHVAWKQELEMWRQDAAAWQKEQTSLLNDVKVALFAEKGMIQQHLDSISRHQHLIDAHERLLAIFETPPVRQHNEMEARSAASHENQTVGKHEELRRAHERLKQSHRQAMGSIAATLREIAQRGELE